MKNTPAPALLEALEPRLAPAGLVIVTTTGGVLSLTGGTDGGNNNLTITSEALGIWKITAQDGETFKLNGVDIVGNSVDVLAQNGLKVQLGAGNDTLETSFIRIPGAVTIADSAGNDTFKFTENIINGAVKIDTGAGIDTVEFSGINRLNSLLSIKTGADGDTVRLHDGFYRDISVDLGTGSNTYDTNANSFQVHGNFTLAVSGGASDIQDITMGAVDGLITGNLKITNKAGGSGIDIGVFNGDILRVNGSFTVQAGAGDDQLRFNHSTSIGGLLSFKAGDGTNSLIANQVTALTIGGGLTYTGGKGNDFVQFGGVAVTIGGNVSLTMGNGEINSAALTMNDSLTIGGNLVYKGGTLDDILDMRSDTARSHILGNITFTGGNGNNSMFFSTIQGSLGAVTYTGGTGGDIFEIGDSFNNTSLLINVLGPIKASFGTGSSNFSVFDSVVYGTVTTLSATAAGTNEFWTIEGSVMLGKVSQKSTGTAETILEIESTTFHALLELNTGAGSDLLRLDTAFNKGLINDFKGAVKILLGDGDDILFMGNPTLSAFSGNTFRSTFLLDGGQGGDIFVHNASGNFFFVTPVILPTVENQL